MNVPCGVFWARAPGIPMPAGIWRGEPFTKTVRCAWMWNSTCSLVSQRIPSTGWPVALVAVLASGGALGTGTPSGPFGPGGGAGLSVPSVLSEVSFGDDDDPEPPPAAPCFGRSGLSDFLAGLLLPVPVAFGHGTVS